jgi:predicted acetyltransferase
MALHLRWVGPEDLDRVAETRWMCYGHAQKELDRFKELVRLNPLGQPRDLLLAERDGMAVGTTTSLAMKIWSRGAAIPCQGVAWVGTIKAARRRGGSGPGVASALMRETLRLAREKQLVLSALMPFRVSFYEHFGFGVVERRNEWNIPLSILPDADCDAWRFAVPADRPAIAEQWQRSVQAGQCDFERPPLRWQNLFQQQEDGMFFIARSGADKPAAASAYITREAVDGRNILKVQEFSADDPESFRGLLSFCKTLRDQFSGVSITTPVDWPMNRLLTEPQIPHRPVDHVVPASHVYTRMQLRVLDHKKYLESLHWPESVRGRVLVGIAESEGNLSRFSLELDSGRAAVAPASTEPDFQCTDRIWASIATGDLPASDAVYWGLGQAANPSSSALLDALCAGPKPFSREYF